MTELKIGSYEISSQELYDALVELKKTDDSDLKLLDKDGDFKLSEDELAELDAKSSDEDEDEGDSDTTKSKWAEKFSGTTLSSILALQETVDSLEEELNSARARICKASDSSELADIISSMQDTMTNITNTKMQIYNLMVQAENNVSGTGSASGVSSVNGTSGTASGNNLDTSSAANFALSLVNNGSTSIDAGTMQSKMSAAGCQFDAGAWCGDFCSYVLHEVYGQDGSPGDYLNSCSNPAYVPSIRDWAETKGVLSSNASDVQPGDLILYGNQHVGMVVKVNSDGTVDTVEGNTSNDQTGEYSSPTGDGWCSYHSHKTGDYVLLHAA